MLDPWSFVLFAKTFQFPDSGPLLLEGHLQAFLFCSSIYAFPPPGLLPFLQGNCSVQGIHAFACSFDFEQYMDFVPGLPGGSLPTALAITRSAR